MKTRYILFILLASITSIKTAYADEVNFGKNTPSANQVIEALTPSVNTDAGDANLGHEGKSRSIDMTSLGGFKKPISATEPSEAPKVSKKKHGNGKIARKSEPKPRTETALSMEILFGYNSADLTEAAKTQLKPVGEALASEKLNNLSFIVEGHTDAVGGDAYNKNLSKERADAVRQYFVDGFHVKADRVQIVGKGKSQLYDPKNPYSEANRRVRIIATK